MTLDEDEGEKKKKDGIVLFFVSGSDELDVVCVKASEFMHTRKHTHIIHDWILSPFSPFRGDEVKER